MHREEDSAASPLLRGGRTWFGLPPARSGSALPPTDYALAALVVALASGGHLFGTWLVDTVPVRIYPLPLILVGYVGYRMGRRAGLIAGLLAPLPWLYAVARAEPGAGSTLLGRWVELGELRVVGVSAQYVVLEGAFGFLSGVLFDAADRVLRAGGASIRTVARIGVGGLAISHLGSALGRWTEAADRTGDEGDAPRSRVGLLSRIGGLVVLVGILHLAPSWTFDWGELRVPPAGTAELVVGAYAFLAGTRKGLALLLGSWVLSFVIGQGLANAEVPVGPLREVLPAASPYRLVLAVVVVWWAGQVGAWLRSKDGAFWSGSWLRAHALPANEERPPSLSLVVAFLVCSLGLEITWDAFALQLRPHVVLLVVAVLAARAYDPVAVSNRLLAVLLATAFVAPSYAVTERYSIAPLTTNAPTVFGLAALPLVAGRIDLRRRDPCRLLFLGLLAFWGLANGLLEGSWERCSSVRVRLDDGTTLALASFLAEVLLFAAAASAVRALAGRRGRRRTLVVGAWIGAVAVASAIFAVRRAEARSAEPSASEGSEGSEEAVQRIRVELATLVLEGRGYGSPELTRRLDAWRLTTDWKLVLSPFRGKGYRERAIVTWRHLAGGELQLDVVVERQHNLSLADPLHPARVEWDDVVAVPDVADALRQAIAERFEDVPAPDSDSDAR